MSGEELKIVCHECGEWVAPYEYNSSDGEAWFLNGRFWGEIRVKCPHCGYHNYVSFGIEKARVLEVK